MQKDLKRYCVVKTGSEWDVDDLVQETLVKAFRWFERFPDREITKTFLYRIAANAWIDQCRRNKRQVSTNELDENLIVRYADWHKCDVREALELLSDRLEPRQVVLILLIDVFSMTTKETGLLFGQTEGAVKSALHRARTRLNQAADHHPEYWDESVLSTPRRGLSVDTFESFVAAFRRADPHAIYHSYRSMVEEGTSIETIHLQGETLYFYFKDPDGNSLMITGRVKEK